MVSLAANEFKQRSDSPSENNLDFDSWYHINDIERIIWQTYQNLSEELKAQTLQPAVLLDGIDIFIQELGLDAVLDPLITILQESPQKYLPFIFKPELGGCHYMAGFLRKNEQGVVSIALFNPTGTPPRIKLGSYAPYSFDSYDAENEDFEFKKNVFYFHVDDGNLSYELINSEGFIESNSLTPQELQELGINLNIKQSLTELIKDQLEPKRERILKKTLEKGDTEPKTEILFSTQKVQTRKRDGGNLVSCGPLAVEFVDHLMKYPEEMGDQDKEVSLPDHLRIVSEFKVVNNYKSYIMDVRQKHYKLLDSISDEAAKAEGAVDTSYENYNKAILNHTDRLHSENDLKEHLLKAGEEELSQGVGFEDSSTKQEQSQLQKEGGEIPTTVNLEALRDEQLKAEEQLKVEERAAQEKAEKVAQEQAAKQAQVANQSETTKVVAKEAKGKAKKPVEKHPAQEASTEAVKESTKYAAYVDKLLAVTQAYKEDLSDDNIPTHEIVDLLIEKLNEGKTKATIEGFYQILNYKKDRDSDSNLTIIEKNDERSTKRFIQGIALITVILVTGILPGLLIMAAVSALTKKISSSPFSFFKPLGKDFQEKLAKLEAENKLENNSSNTIGK